jgi:hypothetical protein
MATDRTPVSHNLLIMIGLIIVVGEFGMVGSHIRTATLIARQPTRLLKLDYQRFHRFLLAFPEAAVALLGDTVQKMTELIRSMKNRKIA